MKKILKIIGLIIFVLVLIVSIFLIYSGLFSNVEIKEAVMGPYTIVYLDYTGDYSGVGKPMDELYNALLADEIETYQGIGIYYDDPKNTPTDQLRSKIGCILEEKDFPKIEDLKKKYNIMTFEEKNSLTTEFPFKNQFSIILGIIKVYPAITEYTQKKGYQSGPIMEIYDMPNNKIIYVMNLT